jgi:hypothetical protein
MTTPFPALKKLTKKIVRRNPLEAFDEPTGIVKGVADSLKKDVIGMESARQMWKQLLVDEEKASTHKEVEMHEGEEVDLMGHGEKKDNHGHVEAGIDYHREITHFAERAHHHENTELEQKVQEIVNELQRLVDSSSTLIQAEYQDIAVMQAPSEVGKYHVNFFDWMLSVIQNARMKVEDSGAWLTAMQSKKGKKNYWAMFKKHGTTFGMSNERQVSTQTG